MCQIHKVDVLKDGLFDQPNENERTRKIPSDPTAASEFWDELQGPVGDMFYTLSFLRI